MNRVTYLSKHAADRLAQRSTLTEYELAKILDCHMFVKIAKVPGFNREHRLFYSRKDELFYIVIQDAYTGGVITILPPLYYENISKKIKEKKYIEAENIALTPPNYYYNYEKKIRIIIPKIQPSVFVLSAHYNNIMRDQKTKVILKEKSKPYNNDINEFINRKLLSQNILLSLANKNIETESVWSISIRLGCKGTPKFFDWENNLLV